MPLSDGWNDLKWGMILEDIRALYEIRLQQQKYRDKFDKIEGIESYRVISKIPLVEECVLFFFQNKLFAILMRYEAFDDQLDRIAKREGRPTFETIIATASNKYGPPEQAALFDKDLIGLYGKCLDFRTWESDNTKSTIFKAHIGIAMPTWGEYVEKQTIDTLENILKKEEMDKGSNLIF